ncbi:MULTISPECIES: M23 family metallopeptidase [unclassified Actinobaculum]|uniref:M23 family metallopeptidase n=1 Tax=unclassified Actinobaculum TaxID=2609299 RepID=UPI000D528603|nr:MULTISPECIES: M23 family metallopeptidase [unclassified Actinobaculum]AWE42668.1 hypothetical protein DDD63_07820 [Actinobaculum sp. 313]RTE49478.1 M23 family peptidase [Actinobaculum sp. 352]
MRSRLSALSIVSLLSLFAAAVLPAAAGTREHTAATHDAAVYTVAFPAARATSSPSTITSGELPTTERAETAYDWPSGHEVPVLRAFSPPAQRWLSGHRGVDLALNEGDTVYAAGAGSVVYAGRLNDRNVISIEHSGGLRTTYEPVAPTVKRGDHVECGDPIGTVEGTHCGPFACLHWGAKYSDDRYIDPLSLLHKKVIRLWR